MNNRVQQRFDRSIAEAVAETRAAAAIPSPGDVAAATARRARLAAPVRRTPKPKGRLFLCPITGATVWEPAPARKD